MKTQETTQIAAVFILLIGLGVPLLQHPPLVLMLLPVCTFTLLLTWQATRSWALALAAAGLAPLLIGDLTSGAAAAIILLLALLSVYAESPLPFLLVVPALLWDTPAQGLLFATAIAFLVSWPPKPEPTPAPGIRGPPVPPVGQRDRLQIGLAVLLTLLATALVTPVWAGAAGLAAGFGARLIGRHPKNARIAASTRRLAYFAAPLPAVFLFLLSALGRLEPLSPLRTVITGWGTIGLGLLTIAIGIGIALLLAARGPWATLALTGAALIAVFLLGAVLQNIGTALLAAAVLWPLVAPWTVVGTTQLTKQAPPLIVWPALMLATVLAQGVRILPGFT